MSPDCRYIGTKLNIGLVWCLLLLVKTMATAHDFGLWKSAGTIALTWMVMYVLAPIALFLATGFMLG